MVGHCSLVVRSAGGRGRRGNEAVQGRKRGTDADADGGWVGLLGLIAGREGGRDKQRGREIQLIQL